MTQPPEARDRQADPTTSSLSEMVTTGTEPADREEFEPVTDSGHTDSASPTGTAEDAPTGSAGEQGGSAGGTGSAEEQGGSGSAGEG
jgi:hypothetical protein